MHAKERSALADLKMASPTDIQTALLSSPIPLPGHYLLALAPSGTGKTIAYLLKIARELEESKRTTQALVVLPTRELVLQSHDVATKLFGPRGLVCKTVLPDEKDRSVVAAHVIFAPPKSLVTKLKFKQVIAKDVKTLVLDEADQLLMQPTFAADIALILSELHSKASVYAISATWPSTAAATAKRIFPPTQTPTVVRVERASKRAIADTMTQYVMQVQDEKDKRVQIRSMLTTASVGGSTMVFFQRGQEAEQLAKELKEEGFSVASLFAKNMTPQERDVAMKNFTTRKCTVLLTTNVLSRGIDITHVTYVINFDLPVEDRKGELDETTYLHRVGRTARFGRTGMAFTLVSSNLELDKLRVMEAKYGAPLAVLPRPSEQPDAFDEVVKKQLATATGTTSK